MKAIVPVAIVLGLLVASYLFQPAETALDVRVRGTSHAVTVKVVKPGEDTIVARGSTGSEGRVRLTVDPGRYRVGADAPREGLRVRAVGVAVEEDELQRVTLKVERRR